MSSEVFIVFPRKNMKTGEKNLKMLRRISAAYCSHFSLLFTKLVVIGFTRLMFGGRPVSPANTKHFLLLLKSDATFPRVHMQPRIATGDQVGRVDRSCWPVRGR